MVATMKVAPAEADADAVLETLPDATEDDSPAADTSTIAAVAAVAAVFVVLFLLVCICASVMYCKEKQGTPIFVDLESIKKAARTDNGGVEVTANQN